MAIDWQKVISAAEVLRDAAGEIDSLVSKSNPTETTLSELARVMIPLEEVHRILGHAEEMIGSWVVVMMEGDEMEIPDVGRLVRKWSKARRNWSSERLLDDVIAASKRGLSPHGVDPDTGEMIHTWEQAILALKRAYNLSGYAVRTKVVKDLGLYTADYCEEDAWRASVSVAPFTDEEKLDHDDR
jgi:hypothetical protein